MPGWEIIWSINTEPGIVIKEGIRMRRSLSGVQSFADCCRKLLLHREGQLPAAKEYLLTLLQKRLAESYYNERKAEIETMNQEQLLADIMEERARELVFEGHRWFDLRRTTRPEVNKKLYGWPIGIRLRLRSGRTIPSILFLIRKKRFRIIRN